MMYHTAPVDRTMLSRSDGPVCMHAVGDPAGEVVLEERPALAHDVPMVLPAHEVAQPRDERLFVIKRL